MTLTVYNPKGVTITYGAQEILGLADGDFITVSKVKPKRTYKTGVAGEFFTMNSNCNVTELKISLLQNSESNGLFNFLQSLPIISELLHVMDDASGHILIFTNCTVTEETDFNYGTTGNTRIWTIVGEMTLSFVNPV